MDTFFLFERRVLIIYLSLDGQKISFLIGLLHCCSIFVFLCVARKVVRSNLLMSMQVSLFMHSSFLLGTILPR